MKKNIIKYFALTSILAATFFNNCVVFANTNNSAQTIETNKTELNNEIKDELIENLIELGVTDSETQLNLINKLESGLVWDSMNQDIISSIPSELINPSIEEPFKRYVFEDGSVLINSIDSANSQMRLMPSTRDYGGTGYYVYENVKIYKKSGLVTVGFYADICLVKSGYDQIARVHSAYANAIGASVSGVSVKIIDKNEAYKRPAMARARADHSFFAGLASGTTFTTLKVQNDRYWVE